MQRMALGEIAEATHEQNTFAILKRGNRKLDGKFLAIF
jgi:hypothetical protein